MLDTVIGRLAMHAFTGDHLKAGLTECREQTTDCYGHAEYHRGQLALVRAGAYRVREWLVHDQTGSTAIAHSGHRPRGAHGRTSGCTDGPCQRDRV
jgi:hypothetical protein